MALPRSKYSEPRHTPGKEFTLGGKDYVGWYVVTYQDLFYTGKVLDKTSKELLPVKVTPIANQAIFVQQQTSPTPDDYTKGVWKRYFILNVKSRAIVEVAKERFQAFKNKANYRQGILEWKLKGPAENVNKGPYTYFGAEHLNRVNTQALEPTIPGISSFIKDYSQFVE